MENLILGIFGTRPANGLTPDAVKKRRGEEKTEVTGYLKILNIKSTLVYVGKHVLIFFRHFVAHIRLIFIMHYGYQLWTCIVYISTLPFVFCLCTVATSSSRFQDIEDVFVIGCRKSSRNV